MSNTWTSEQHKIVVDGLEQGYSCAQISSMLGHEKSRNAVIGYISRKGLRPHRKKAKPRRTGRPPRLGPRKTPFNAPMIQNLEPLPEPEKPVDINEPKSKNLELWELPSCGCKYATNKAGEGETHLFCGHKRQEGSPYCEYHHRITHETVLIRRQRKQKWMEERGYA